mgnify:CR=1 FL=1
MRRLLAVVLLALSGVSHAAIQTQEIPYTSADGTKLIGYYAYDDAVKGPRPGVVVVHEWWGLNDYAKRRARDLAGLGYSALAIDMYGDGKNTEHPKDALAFMQAALKDGKAASARFQAGLDLLKKQPQTDPDKIAAIGYCFGGSTVLNMALEGMDLQAVASFHGGGLHTAEATSPHLLIPKTNAQYLILVADNAEGVVAGMDMTFSGFPIGRVRRIELADTGNVRILIRHILARIQHQHHHIGGLDGLQGRFGLEGLRRIDHGRAVGQTAQVGRDHAEAMIERHRDAQPVLMGELDRLGREALAQLDVAPLPAR